MVSGYSNFIMVQKVTRSQDINGSANFHFLHRLSIIFGFRRNCPSSLASSRPGKMASCRDCPCDSHGQSLQKAIYQAQQSRQKARGRGQSGRQPNMTDSLCRKQKLADLFIPYAGSYPSCIILSLSIQQYMGT